MRRPAVLAVLWLTACVAAGPADDPAPEIAAAADVAGDAAPADAGAVLGRHDAPLYGNVVPSRCNRWQKVRMREAMTVGRTLASSSAFSQCVDRAMRVGSIDGPDGSIGPYQECRSGPVAGDPYSGRAISEQIQYALRATRSHNNIRIQCSSAAKAGEGLILGVTESVEIRFGQGPLSSGAGLVEHAGQAKMIWHEAMHNWGYRHNANFRTRDCAQHGFGNSVPYIVQGCMGIVAEESAARCGARTCEGPRIAVIDGYPVSSDTDCECVRDHPHHAPVLGDSVQDAGYGSALAAGDFDGDSFSDLAVAAPYENDLKGAVYLYRGSELGLKPWALLRGSQELGMFGFALATGDLNGDGQQDLAIGAPGSSLVEGYVYLYRGNVEKRPSFVRRLGQDGLGANEPGDLFGHALAIGNVFDRGRAGLVIGAPGERIHGNAVKSGAAYLFEGAGEELLVQPIGVLTQDKIGLNADGDRFGAALAVGDVDLDPGQDIVVGAPGDTDVGRVYVFLHVSRESRANRARWLLSPAPSTGVWPGASPARFVRAPEHGMEYGASLAIARVGAGGAIRIAVGAPQASGGRGRVYLHAGPEPVIDALDQTQPTVQGGRLDAVFSGTSSDQHFGASLQRVARDPYDVDGGGEHLAVGIPGQSAGRVRLYGPSPSGTSLVLTLSQTGMGMEEPGDQFGSALASGDFNNDSSCDLVVGAEGEAPGDLPAAGAVFHFNGNRTSRYQAFRFYHQRN